MAGAAARWAAAAAAVVGVAVAQEDPLNPDDAKPLLYQQATAIQDQHENTIRWSNEIKVPGEEEGWEEYWYGLLIFPAVFLMILVGWCGMVCLAPCCKCAYRTDPKTRRYGFGTFCAASLGAFLCWTLVFSVADDLSSSTDGLARTATLLDEVVLDLQGIGQQLLDGVDEAELELVAVENECDQFASQIDSEVRPILERLRTDISSTLENLPDLHETLDETESLADNDAGQVAVFVYGTLMVLLTVFFLVATAIRYCDPGGKRMKRCKICLARSSCFSVFTLGLIFITLAILLASIAAAVSSVGADTCSPTPEVKLQKLGGVLLKAAPLATDSSFGVPLCTPIPDSKYSNVDVSLQILCYYQTCSGDQVISKVVEELKQLNNTDFELPTTGPTEECRASVAALSRTVSTVLATAIVQIINLFRCSRINPIYSAAVHDFMCLGVVETTVAAWKYFLSGSILLLFALFLHRHFRLAYPKDHVFLSKKAKRQYHETTTNDADFDSDQEHDDLAGQHGGNNVPLVTAEEISGVKPVVAEAEVVQGDSRHHDSFTSDSVAVSRDGDSDDMNAKGSLVII